MAKQTNYQFPLVIERDEDDFYIVECPVFSGCYTQGKTMSEAIKNIKEVIDLCLEEKDNSSPSKSRHWPFTQTHSRCQYYACNIFKTITLKFPSAIFS